MEEKQSSPFYKKTNFILAIILGVFLTKGLLMSATLPAFQGPDEIVHYSTVIYYSLPPEKQQVIRDVPKGEHKSMTEEQTNFTKLIEAVDLNNSPNSTQKFSEGSDGAKEDEILNNSWDKEFDINSVPYVTDYPAFYYRSAAIPEQLVKNENVLSRFFVARIFSVLLGMFVVFLSYKISRTIGLSKKISLLATATISFQPMLGATSAIVNPDAMLIFTFTVFAWGMSLFLRDGAKFNNIILLIASTAAAVFTKGPGIVLAGMLGILIVYEIQRKTKLSWKKIILASAVLGIIAFLILPQGYREKIIRTDRASVFPSFSASLGKYLDERTFDIGRLKFTGESYWGNFGSLAVSLDDWALNLIYDVEAISMVGLILFFSGVKREYLPSRRFIVFFIILMLSLQIAIRFYDWRVFDINGKALISTPGRYFIPNVAIHLLTVIVGLGTLCKTEKRFVTILKLFVVLLALITIYTIINVIIPHYYL